jgi:hypothetical protein
MIRSYREKPSLEDDLLNWEVGVLFECFQIDSAIVGVQEHFSGYFPEIRQPLGHLFFVFRSSFSNGSVLNGKVTIILNLSLKQRKDAYH